MMNSNATKKTLPSTRNVRNQKCHRGYISVEFGVVLLLIGTLIVGAVLFFVDNLRKNSINQNVSYIQLTAGNARSTYGERNQYSQLTTAIAVQSQVIPTNLRDGAAATATNPFGSAITIAPATTAGANSADVLDLTWGNVPGNQCSGIVTGAENSARQVTVNGTVVKPLDGVLNIGLMATNCEGGANGNVPIIFRIGR